MNPHLFAMAQGQVAEQVATKPALRAGMNAAGLKRLATMIAFGSVAAVTIGMAAPNASAMTQSQVEDIRQRQQLDREFAEQRRQDALRAEHHRAAEQRKQQVVGMVMNIGAGSIQQAISASFQEQAQERRLQQDLRAREARMLQDQRLNAQRYAPQGPAFYMPSDLGMPARFTQVTQRTRVGMLQPSGQRLDLRDGSQISNSMVRAMQSLETALDRYEQAGQSVQDGRAQGGPLQGASRQRFAAANGDVDRAIENYMRVSNDAGMRGLNAGPFNQLVAQMVRERLVSDQQVDMSVNARIANGYSR